MFCRKPIVNLEGNPEYLATKFYGHGKKTIAEDMICFQQAACAYLKHCKKHNVQDLWKAGQLNTNKEFDATLARLQKYLNRVNEIVQCKCKKFERINEEIVFNEIDKVI